MLTYKQEIIDRLKWGGTTFSHYLGDCKGLLAYREVILFLCMILISCNKPVEQETIGDTFEKASQPIGIIVGCSFVQL